METQEFIMLFLRRRGKINDRNEFGWSWKEWFSYAKLTKLVDFGCDFKDNICVKYREIFPNSNSANKIYCCCRNCAVNIGYLQVIPDEMRIINKIASKFSKKTGFWSNEGCRLPRELRSGLCLTFRCMESIKTIEHKDEGNLLEILSTPCFNTIIGKPINFKVYSSKGKFIKKKIPSVKVLREMLTTKK